ncbi:hypothetical protein ACWGVR_33975 [Streptomyces xanthophaeus]
MTVVAAFAASEVHTLWEVSDNTVDDGVVRGVIPWDGTRSEVSARRAGGDGLLGAAPTQSTGRLRQAAEMIYISYVQVGR